MTESISLILGLNLNAVPPIDPDEPITEVRAAAEQAFGGMPTVSGRQINIGRGGDAGGLLVDFAPSTRRGRGLAARGLYDLAHLLCQDFGGLRVFNQLQLALDV
jgi:hypothetical protein